MEVIKVNGLCRTYEVKKQKGKSIFFRDVTSVDAVKDISFSIKKGEKVGFIGPNGAGKSTTIKMMTGILLPSKGTVEVLGKDPYTNRKENAKKIGVLFGQKSQLWWDLPVNDTFTLLKSIYKIPEEVYCESLHKYTQILGIDEFIYQPVRQLSLGQRMRAEFCAALLHNPEILFLDEPTIGLDIVVKRQIRELINTINKELKTTIILTTHDLKDIEDICERIILINAGRIIVDDSVYNVKKNFKGNFSIQFVCNDELKEDIIISHTIGFEKNKEGFKIYYEDKKLAASIIQEVINKYNVLDIKMDDPNIDDIISVLYQVK